MLFVSPQIWAATADSILEKPASILVLKGKLRLNLFEIFFRATVVV